MISNTLKWLASKALFVALISIILRISIDLLDDNLLKWFGVSRLSKVASFWSGWVIPPLIPFASVMLDEKITNNLDPWLRRAHYSTKRRFATVGQNFLSAETFEEIESVLVEEPLRTFNLVSAALYSLERGEYVSRLVIGAEMDFPAKSVADWARVLIDRIPNRKAVRRKEIQELTSEFSAERSNPSLAVGIGPINQLHSIALYGPMPPAKTSIPKRLS